MARIGGGYKKKEVKRQIAFKKIPGADNPADLFTKPLSAEIINKHMATLMVEFEAGRASKAPTLALRTWHRRDRNTTSMKMTGTTGPNWQGVTERITDDMHRQSVIARDDIEGRPNRWLKRVLDERDTQVELRNECGHIRHLAVLATGSTEREGGFGSWRY